MFTQFQCCKNILYIVKNTFTLREYFLYLVKLTCYMSEFLEILYFKIIPASEIPKGTSLPAIITMADSYPEFPHIAGTTFIGSAQKISAAGTYWEHQFQFSVSSYVNDSLISQVKNVGAIVIYTDTRTLLFNKNDYFQNIPIDPEIEANTDLTDIRFNYNSLSIL